MWCRPSTWPGNEKLPDAVGVWVKLVASATPEAFSMNALDVAAAGAVQVPLVNFRERHRPRRRAEGAHHCCLVVHRRPRRHRRRHTVGGVVDQRHRVRHNLSDGQRLARTSRVVVRAVARVRRPERNSPTRRHLRERRRRARTPEAFDANGVDVAVAGAAQVPWRTTRTSPSPSASANRFVLSPSPGRAPSSPPAPTSPDRGRRRGSPSPSTSPPPSPGAGSHGPVELL